MNWEPRAAQLAAAVTHPASRWRPAVTAVPRHLFIPRWWAWAAPGPGLWHDIWELRDGPASPAAWLDAAYSDRSLITRVGTAHADHAARGEPTPRESRRRCPPSPGLLSRCTGTPRSRTTATYSTSEPAPATEPHSCASASRDTHVTSIDVDEYLTKTAADRLDAIGLHPQIITGDATALLPGTYDRIVSMVDRPTRALLMARRAPPWRPPRDHDRRNRAARHRRQDPRRRATGRTEWYRAGFMEARTGTDYPSGLLDTLADARHGDGDETSTGRYPVIDIGGAWELTPWSASQPRNPDPL